MDADRPPVAAPEPLGLQQPVGPGRPDRYGAVALRLFEVLDTGPYGGELQAQPGLQGAEAWQVRGQFAHAFESSPLSVSLRYGRRMGNRHEDGVRARIREMAARDPDRKRFGASTHRYALAPRLPEAEIRAFEKTHGIALPGEYRSFVAVVGDGPAGPGHGLMPLTVPRPETDEEWAVDDAWAEDRLPGRLAAPFPLAEPLPGRLGAPVDALTRGTLMLAEQGCGGFDRLVLNGPYAGEVWQIDPDWGGFVPVSPGFRAWYTDWLAGP